MKLTIDTSGGDEADDLLARAYLASVIGPRRRPHGRNLQIVLQPAPVQIATNTTGRQVLFVAVTVPAGPAAISYFMDGGGGNPMSIKGGDPPESSTFILFPGEQLWASVPGAGPTPTSVFTSPF